jgi:hypothetical protein
MATGRERVSELLHFGLWVEMTMLMNFLTVDERDQLLRALGVTPAEYEVTSVTYLEILSTNSDPVRTAIYRLAATDAAEGGRERAIERFNRFLDGLTSP